MERNCKSIKLFGVEIPTTTTEEDIIGRKMKKGNRWTKDEHRAFLKGLDFHGKGNWAKIAKDFLPSRTSTQVASHAQKYFVRLLDANERKKRKKSSVFDLHLEKTEVIHGAIVPLGNDEESDNRVLPLTWVYMYPYHHHYASTSSCTATTFDKPLSGISSSSSSSSMDNNLELTL